MLTDEEILAIEGSVWGEYGFPGVEYSKEYIIGLARAIEREVIERCAKVCDTEWNGDADTYEAAEACNECAAAIRGMK